MVTYSSFDLHFLSDQWCSTSFHVLTVFKLYKNIYIFFVKKCLLKSFAQFFTEFIFLLFSCKSLLYILDVKLLSGILYANILTHSIGCVFTSLIMSYKAQKVLILMKLNFNLHSPEKMGLHTPILCLWKQKHRNITMVIPKLRTSNRVTSHHLGAPTGSKCMLLLLYHTVYSQYFFLQD